MGDAKWALSPLALKPLPGTGTAKMTKFGNLEKKTFSCKFNLFGPKYLGSGANSVKFRNDMYTSYFQPKTSSSEPKKNGSVI